MHELLLEHLRFGIEIVYRYGGTRYYRVHVLTLLSRCHMETKKRSVGLFYCLSTLIEMQLPWATNSSYPTLSVNNNLSFRAKCMDTQINNSDIPHSHIILCNSTSFSGDSYFDFLYSPLSAINKVWQFTNTHWIIHSCHTNVLFNVYLWVLFIDSVGSVMSKPCWAI